MPFLSEGYEFLEKQVCHLTTRNFTFAVVNDEFLAGS